MDDPQTHNSESPRAKIRVIILGSTGSIGTNTLQVIQHLNQQPTAKHDYEVVGLAAGNNHQLALNQAQKFNVKHLALAQPPENLSTQDFPGKILTGENAAQKLVEEIESDLIVAAIVGIAGLPAVVAGITNGTTIALANKETLVAAGSFIMQLAADRHAQIIPVDSEHSAIFQALQNTNHNDHTHSQHQEIKRIILTASGGPFRNWPVEKIASATPTQALNHPTWKMGAKVTIDSASLTNKALEMIEAHHLFNLPNQKIDILIHPQSIVHGMVEFNDHSTLAQMGTPDMRTPIQYALTYPNRQAGCSYPIDWQSLSQLTFEIPDENKFPALKLGRRVIDQGQNTGLTFNAANEIAVQAFLQNKIKFPDIATLAQRTLDQTPLTKIESLQHALDLNQQARGHTTTLLNSTTTTISTP